MNSLIKLRNTLDKLFRKIGPTPKWPTTSWLLYGDAKSAGIAIIRHKLGFALIDFIHCHSINKRRDEITEREYEIIKFIRYLREISDCIEESHPYVTSLSRVNIMSRLKQIRQKEKK